MNTSKDEETKSDKIKTLIKCVNLLNDVSLKLL